MTDPRDAAVLRWGISTLGCAELSLPAICALLSEFGLHELEIRSVDGRMDLPQWAAEANWSPSLANELLARQEIHFCVAGSSFKLVGNDEKSRSELLAFCEWADSWGAPYVRVFGGGTWGQPLTSENFAQAGETVSWWRREKFARGWRVELLL